MVRARWVRIVTVVIGLVSVLVPSAGSAVRTCPRRPANCHLRSISSTEVSTTAGLGRLEIAGDRAAVLQRDEGIVALLDMTDRASPKVIASYDDGAEDSFDGDLAFSNDGEWLFYARQTHQFSKDGIHVLHVDEGNALNLSSYEPAGGAFRVAYFEQDRAEWVVLLDATHGLVVHQFVRESGTLTPVHTDALPALKVGGPASAGLFIDPKDPITGTPLLYVTTGKTCTPVFDFSDPTAPALLGAWDKVGLAEVEVRASASKRTIYAATEYWFDKALKPEVVVLDATKLGRIKQTDRWDLRVAADDRFRVQGMDLAGRNLQVAHSTMGLVVFDRAGRIVGRLDPRGDVNTGAGVVGTPYSMDVEFSRGLSYITDASTGRLTVARSRRR